MDQDYILEDLTGLADEWMWEGEVKIPVRNVK